MHQNQIVYQTLRDRGYEVVILGRHQIDEGYPTDWRNNDRLILKRPFKTALQRANLLELAGKYPAIVGSEPPALVICGSRGCQVTVGLLWRHFWRGPTVLINAGCLTGTTTTIPREVFPVLIPCGEDDLFKHDRRSGIQNLINAFERFSESDGILLHLTNQGHMPDDLHRIIVRVVQLTLGQEKAVDAWTAQLTEPWCRVQKLESKKLQQAGSSNGKKRKQEDASSSNGKKRMSLPFIVKNANRNRDHTYLRSKPRASSAWGARVANDTPIDILEVVKSDDGFIMYRVQTPTNENGYIYAMNVQ